MIDNLAKAMQNELANSHKCNEIIKNAELNGYQCQVKRISNKSEDEANSKKYNNRLASSMVNKEIKFYFQICYYSKSVTFWRIAHLGYDMNKVMLQGTCLRRMSLDWPQNFSLKFFSE